MTLQGNIRRADGSGWFSFLYPGQAAALKAEEKLNAQKIQANAEQNYLEAMMSLQLTKEDNQKMLIGIGLISAALIIYIMKN
jgi:hypothetical protein